MAEKTFPSDRVVLARDDALAVHEFRRVLVESGLGTTRPVDDEARLREMLAGANLVVTARLCNAVPRLIGVARCITDHAWCCYVAELAVSRDGQGLGVGRALLEEVRRLVGPRVSVMLASVLEAVGFYERIGMSRVPDAFSWKREV
jgi:GNAT superfamily N-acetyltransferase